MKKALLASDLANLVDRLSDAQALRIASLVSAKRVSAKTSGFIAEGLLDLHGSSLDSVISVLKQWRGIEPALEAGIIAAVRVRQSVARTVDTVSVVWTGPVQFSAPTRSTLSLTREMILAAKNRVTIVGYRVTQGARPVFEALGAAYRRGVGVRLILDSASEQMKVLQQLWPVKKHLPEIFDKKTEGTLHAKVVVVDGLDMLVTSANLTTHGLRSNIEIGVRVQGPTASQVDALLNKLVRTRHFSVVKEPAGRNRLF